MYKFEEGNIYWIKYQYTNNNDTSIVTQILRYSDTLVGDSSSLMFEQLGTTKYAVINSKDIINSQLVEIPSL
jgi:hypothetical protein